MDASAIAQQHVKAYLAEKMPQHTETHASILRCCILNAVAPELTDDDFIGRVGDHPTYKRKAKQIYETVGGDVFGLIYDVLDEMNGTTA